MTSRRFLLLGVGLALLLAGTLCAFNISMDEFGLFGLRRGPIRIWGYERASKFLLAQRYVPEHFEGVLLGSSSSDMMMDTRRLTGYAVYNLSITGGNICEVARVAHEALESGRIRFVVIALSPYLTKDCVMKTNELNPGLKGAVLGSLFTLRFYQSKLRLLLHPETDSFRDSWSGFQYDIPLPAAERMGARERPMSTEDPVNPEAAQELALLLQEAKASGVKVLAYFHPLLRPEINEGYPEPYLREMRSLLAQADLLWDFNDGTYPEITGHAKNFLDGVHLSARGAPLVLDAIREKLDTVYDRTTRGVGHRP